MHLIFQSHDLLLQCLLLRILLVADVSLFLQARGHGNLFGVDLLAQVGTLRLVNCDLVLFSRWTNFVDYWLGVDTSGQLLLVLRVHLVADREQSSLVAR